MQWNDILAALCLVMVIEGVLPFVSPKRYKEFLASMQDMPESTIRNIGLATMVFGLICLYFVKN